MYHFIYPIKDTYIYELNDNSEKNFGGDDVCEAYSDYRCYMCYSDANQGTEGWSKCDPNVHKVHTFDMNFWG